MKQFTTDGKDTCWRDALACILEVKPGEVPDFVKLYGNGYMDRTREWLASNYRKGIVYVPVNEFMQLGELRFNAPMGPSGYSIGYVRMQELDSEESEKCSHALICFNGGVVWDNGDDRHKEYSHIEGYFIIYDLEGRRVRKRGKRTV